MARKREGQVVERRWRSGRGYALRFDAYGERRYLTVGLEADGYTRQDAETELANIMADVRRGIWTPPQRKPNTNPGEDSPAPVMTVNLTPRFGAFASDWLAGRTHEVSERTVEYETWAVRGHLLPYFASWQLDEIDIKAVDDYRRHKVTESEQRRTALRRGRPRRGKTGLPLRPLAPGTINKTIETLQAILAVAVEYGHIPNNPAAGRRRRLKTPPKSPIYLDTVDQIQAVLDAAKELDTSTRHRSTDRYPLIATLLFAGPRAHEACLLRWRDVDLTNGRIEIRRSKTQAGLRQINLLPILRQALTEHKAKSPWNTPDDLVFPTAAGTVRDKDNLRQQVVGVTLERADELLRERRLMPLPPGITPHKLRHTFASILVACGEDPASLMAQMGHTDPNFTLRVYTHMIRRNEREREHLRELVYGT